MFRNMFQAAMVLATLLMGVEQAAAKHETDTITLVESFVEICLGTLPDTNKVKSLADLRKWQPLPEHLAPMVAPANPTAQWQGWYDRSKKQVLGISQGLIDGKKPVCSCVLAGLEGDYKGAHHHLLISQADLVLREEKTEAGLRVARYTGTLMGLPLTIYISGPVEGRGMILSAAVFER